MSTAPMLAPACQNHPEVTTGLKACARCGNTFCPDCVVELQGRAACATCKDEVLRDLRSGASELDLAGAGKRLVGVIVDGLIIGLPTFVLAYFTIGLAGLTSGDLGTSLGFGLLSGLVYFVYDGLMTANGGQTLGKKATGMKVVTAEGNEVSASQAWTRAGSRVVMQLTRILGLVDGLMVFSERKRTLHDRIAKTVVINWRE